jgi:lysophospholipase L1-like esterase
MPVITVFTPDAAEHPDRPAPLSDFNRQFIAQGDSWFSMGGLPLQSSNLFDGMSTRTAACAVNFASPGAVLRRMTDTVRERRFLRHLNGPLSRRWSALLLSGGGNDLIEAAAVAPTQPAALRLLATQAEWGAGVGEDRYLSDAGWQTFSVHLDAVMRQLLRERDRGLNRGIPVALHTYDLAVPRPSGAGFGRGPWLQPSLVKYGIPQDAWAAVSALMLRRLKALLFQIAAAVPDGSVQIVDTQGTLTPARVTDTGATADWLNEIHPTSAGYRKLSAHWAPVLDRL